VWTEPLLKVIGRTSSQAENESATAATTTTTTTTNNNNAITTVIRITNLTVSKPTYL
jgi:hypothetical protein